MKKSLIQDKETLTHLKNKKYTLISEIPLYFGRRDFSQYKAGDKIELTEQEYLVYKKHIKE